MRTADQPGVMRRLGRRSGEPRRGHAHLLDAARLDEAAEFAWSLYLYVWISGLLGVVRDWMAELLERAERDGTPLAPRTEAIALYFTRAMAYWQDPGVDVLPGLQSSAALFEQSGDQASAALAGVSMALAYLSAPTGPELPSARAALEASLAGFREARRCLGSGDGPGHARPRRPGHPRMSRGAANGSTRASGWRRPPGEMLGIVIAQHHRGWPKFLAGDIDGRRAGLRRGAGHLARDAPRRRHRVRARGPRGGPRRAAQRGADRSAAGRCAAPPPSRRDREPGRASTPTLPLVDGLREGGASEVLDAAMASGADLPVSEVVARVTD